MSRRKFDLNKKILRGSYINEHRIEYFKEQSYILLKKECHRKGVLFKDPLFPLTNQSLFYSKPMPSGGVRWLRFKLISVLIIDLVCYEKLVIKLNKKKTRSNCERKSKTKIYRK